MWHTKPGGQDVWTWDAVSDRDYQVEAGTHTLTVSHREDGTKLDRLLITNDFDLVPPEPETILNVVEVGEVEFVHNWIHVSFNKPFVNPVVVAGPLNNNGGQPAFVRIRTVDETGFDIRIQEWDYLDGWHNKETVSYLVMEQGNYTLGDGTKVEAGFFTATKTFNDMTFNESFNVQPIVMASITSMNDETPVVGRMRNITVDGLQYSLQEQEANTKDHGTEQIAYIACEASVGRIGETNFFITKTDNDVTNGSRTLSFGQDFGSNPFFLAAMQTTDGGDTANIRCNNKTNLSVDVWVDEEQSRDSETGHTTEVVGYMLFSR